MRKITTLFKRNYRGDRLILNEVVEGNEWVLRGEGVATLKWDGTCCKIENGRLFKRHDRKLHKGAIKKKKATNDFIASKSDFKKAPENWQAAESEPNVHTGHWPGWVPVSDDAPADKWHREPILSGLRDGTYELVGPKIQGNVYNFETHVLIKHGNVILELEALSFEYLKTYLKSLDGEGIVWHHPDGAMVKLRRSDFGFRWPVDKQQEIA